MLLYAHEEFCPALLQRTPLLLAISNVPKPPSPFSKSWQENQSGWRVCQLVQSRTGAALAIVLGLGLCNSRNAKIAAKLAKTMSILFVYIQNGTMGMATYVDATPFHGNLA